MVSCSDSPFLIDECSGEKSITLKPNFFAACSKDNFVRVLGSQNKRQTVLFLLRDIFGHCSFISVVR